MGSEMCIRDRPFFTPEAVFLNVIFLGEAEIKISFMNGLKIILRLNVYYQVVVRFVF